MNLYIRFLLVVYLTAITCNLITVVSIPRGVLTYQTVCKMYAYISVVLVVAIMFAPVKHMTLLLWHTALFAVLSTIISCAFVSISDVYHKL